MQALYRSQPAASCSGRIQSECHPQVSWSLSRRCGQASDCVLLL